MTDRPRATLEIRVDVPDDDANRPIVTILIDGHALVTDGSFIGFDPADLLDSGALVPADPPRRVAVYRCNCGEAGCGCIAPVIAERDGAVLWYDFCDFTGVYVRPIVDEDPQGGRPLDIRNLVFDAAEYLAEVQRASADRSWETEARQTARLLRALVMAADGPLTELGYWIGWVGPTWKGEDVYSVSFFAPMGQVVVTLRPTPASPDAQATEMATQLLETPPGEWNIVSRNEWPAKHVRRVAERQRARRRTLS